MKKLLMIVLLAWVAIAAHAQQYFNVRDPFGSFAVQLRAVAEKNGKYYTTGICWDSVNNAGGGTAYNILGIEFSVFDSAGKKLIDTFYQRQDRDIFNANGKLLPQPDGNFILAVDAVEPGSAPVFMLTIYRFDSLGRMLMEKDFSKPYCTGLSATQDFWRLTDLKPDGQGNWLMLSTIGCVTSRANVDFLLTKLDSSFNVIWHQKYGHATLHDIASKIIIEPDGYILAGGRNDANWFTMGFSYRAQMFKVDTAGNLQWTWLSPLNRLTNFIQDIIKTKDGGYVYCGQGDGVEDVWPNGTTSDVEWKGWVEKLDNNRNIVWNKTISNLRTHTENNNQKAIKELLDGSLVIAGIVIGGFDSTDTLSISYGSLVKLTSTGSVIWQRKYSIPSNGYIYGVYDMNLTSDNGFILAGEAQGIPYPRQQGWLVKVDSNGCMNPQCFFPTSVPDEPKTVKTITIYPNPANDVLKIKSAESLTKATLYLYDVAGRLVLSQKLNQRTTEIAIQDLLSGIYVYKVRSEQGVILQGKFIKQ